MRTFIFFVSLILIVVFGYILTHSEIPFFGNIHKKEKQPISKWQSILIGKWEYEGISKNKEFKKTENGILIFDRDFHFKINRLSIEYFKGFKTSLGLKYDDDISEKIGGSIAGTWKISNAIDFHTTLCNLEKGYSSGYTFSDSTACYHYTDFNLGDFEAETSYMQTVEFSKNKIQFLCEDVSSGEKYVIKLKRIDND